MIVRGDDEVRMVLAGKEDVFSVVSAFDEGVLAKSGLSRLPPPTKLCSGNGDLLVSGFFAVFLTSTSNV